MQLEISINLIEDIDKMALFLNAFERQNNMKVDLQTFEWPNAWAELMKISLYGHGPVISETGSTWMSSLAGQNCLRPFRPSEVSAIGGAGKFLPEAWQSCVDFDNRTTLAIPWTLNTYLAYYRRDLLAQAGVDESTAFTTFENFVHTLASLQESGVEMPLAIPTAGNSPTVLHNASSFVWKKEGNWIGADGKQVLFSDPATLAGLHDYFGLHPFLAHAQNMSNDACLHAYLEGKAAITFRGIDLLTQIKSGNVSMKVSQNTGVAIQPGVPFVGGSNLVIWKHIQPAQEALAVELVHYMTGAANMFTQFQEAGYVPANLEALDQVERDATYLPLTQSLKTGRAFLRVPLWGLVEDKLVKALNNTWQQIFATSEPNIGQILENTLLPLQERLNITLSQ
ncbi:MAG TPA: extracellular solute-binding protein [Anaerolineales bacterium]|nr:extracellular solute-binding protein [Anaerolineales bacterium]